MEEDVVKRARLKAVLNECIYYCRRLSDSVSSERADLRCCGSGELFEKLQTNSDRAEAEVASIHNRIVNLLYSLE